MKDTVIEEQEQELLAGYRKLRPEFKRLIMATVITAVTTELSVTQQTDNRRRASEGSYF